MEAVSTSETSVYFYETTQLYTPEICHLYTRRRKNLKFHRGYNFFRRDFTPVWNKNVIKSFKITAIQHNIMKE
jgi:hypothetical protein